MMKQRILIIDDDIDILEAIQFMLEDAGYSVTTSEKGEYVEHLYDQKGALPDLIILDLLLSGKDGRIIAKELKSHKKTQHIPIIMISAHPIGEAAIKQFGVDDFLAKPFAITDMLTKIKTHLS